MPEIRLGMILFMEVIDANRYNLIIVIKVPLVFGYDVSLNNDGTVLAISEAHDINNCIVINYINNSWNLKGNVINGLENSGGFGSNYMWGEIALNGDGSNNWRILFRSWGSKNI